jgi:YhcH/YjgK/YiaL family protein
MIYDSIKNISLYESLGERIKKGLKYLSETNFNNIESGTYDVEGTDIYSIVSEYNTKPFSSAKWEAHKSYIDIQYMVSGKEKMGFSHHTNMAVIQEYNRVKDVMLLKGEGNYLIVDEKHFVIFFPTDVHMPSVAVNIPKPVKKVVVKVRVDDVIEEVVDNLDNKPEVTEIAQEENNTAE